MLTLRGTFVAILLLWSTEAAAQSFAEKFFPMEKGSYWIYAGTVKWSETLDDSTVIRTKKIRWKMAVIQSFHRGTISAALVKGHPSDLAWYEKDKKPGDYLLVRNGNRFYFLHDEDARNGYRDLVNSKKLPNEEDIFFALPLKPGKHFCDPEQTENPDGSYCWSVDGIQSVGLQNIQGVDPQKYVRYQLAFRTIPDHEFTYLVPEIGITRWIYSHHGSVSDVDVHLVEFHRGVEIR